MRIRVVTYNIHKCRGLDRRVRPQRIADVLRELDAHVIGLQEVVSVPDHPEFDQARLIAAALDMHWAFGDNRRLLGGLYGNVVLSRFPLRSTCNYDITVPGRERRGCLRCDVELTPARSLHFFNAHLGTGFLERRRQGRRLVSGEILCNPHLHGPRVLLGDFNEWTSGLASRLLHTAFAGNSDAICRPARPRTYPGIAPFMSLDHIYFDSGMTLERSGRLRTRYALIASDHLPIWADLLLPPSSL